MYKSTETNIIYKVVNGDVIILGVMENKSLALNYTHYLNDCFGKEGVVYCCDTISGFEGIVPFDVLEKGGKLINRETTVKPKLKFAEVVGSSDFREVRIVNIADYTIPPKDYVDADGYYHVFFEVSDEELSPTLYSSLIVSFCEIVSDYNSDSASGEDCLDDEAVVNIINTIFGN